MYFELMIGGIYRNFPILFILWFIEFLINRKIDSKQIAINFFGALILFSLGNMTMFWVELNLIPYQYVRESSIKNSYVYAFVFIFLYDFVYYFYHRLQHAWKPLWYIHQFHHTDPNMGVLTSFRTHWIERPLQVILISFPIFLFLGHNMSAFRFIAYGFIFVLLYPHMKINISHGYLRKIFTSPNLHRIHHSIKPEESQSNFAQFFPIIDILFKTYHPASGESVETGVEKVKTYTAQLKSMCWPLAGKAYDK